jgi:hypothetical protein
MNNIFSSLIVKLSKVVPSKILVSVVVDQANDYLKDPSEHNAKQLSLSMLSALLSLDTKHSEEDLLRTLQSDDAEGETGS